MGDCCCAGDDEPDGPVKKSASPLDRKNVCCTDIIFLIIFVAFWAGTIYISVYAIMQGDALRLVYGYDTFGNTCNRNNNPEIPNVTLSGQDTTGKTNVFFMDPSLSYLHKTLEVCVEKCPDKTLNDIDEIQEWCIANDVNLCGYDVKLSDIALPENVDKCPSKVDVSFSLLNRCVPDYLHNASLIDTAAEVLKAINADDIGRKVLSDLYNSWKEMLALCFISLAIGLIMVFLIRYIASVMVYVIIVLAAIGSIVGTAFLWWTWYSIKKDSDRAEEAFVTIPLLDVEVDNEIAFLVFAIIATVLTLILLVIIIVMRSRIKLVVALFHEAGSFFLNIPLLLIQPLWTFLILVLFLAFWIVILAYISTADNPVVNRERANGVYNTVDYEEHDPVRYMWWYHIVALIWNSEFILACQQMVIAGTVAEWYFTRNKKSLSCTVCKTTSSVILHHIGTLAFGSFIITLVKLPRLILMYIRTKKKKVPTATLR